MAHISLGVRRKVPEIQHMLKKSGLSLAAAGNQEPESCVPGQRARESFID